MSLPPPLLESVEGFVVVRDDLIPGGTKRRVLPELLRAWPEEEFVYAGPAQGFAQVALAYSAQDAGKRATCFVAKRREPHRLTLEAWEAGASIIMVPHGRLNVVRRRAMDYAAAEGARFLPLGFAGPKMLQGTADLAQGLPIQPSEVWCVAGQGLLTRALQAAWPMARHHAVRIGAPPDVGEARLWVAPEQFAQPARQPPPYPSCPEYDAKLWQFVRRYASEGALVWNVA